MSNIILLGPAIIGIIEGIAESLASIIKLCSGIIADKYGNKKRLAFAGFWRMHCYTPEDNHEMSRVTNNSAR